jgi:membrane protein DedA with SNARE-associated domain
MLELLQQYEYVFLFFGILIGGEIVLLPAVYLAVIGFFGFTPLAAIAILATLITDNFWYAVGRKLPLARAREWAFIRKRKDKIVKASEIFRRHGLNFLLVSKFVYGTRAATHFLCGAHKLSYFRYLVMDVLGILIWLGAILLAGLTIGSSLQALDNAVLKVSLFITVFFALVVIMHVVIMRWYRKQ